ncbi:MAG: hypothetical protein U1F52_09320 [Burkholderiales bacterium]
MPQGAYYFLIDVLCRARRGDLDSAIEGEARFHSATFEPLRARLRDRVGRPLADGDDAAPDQQTHFITRPLQTALARSSDSRWLWASAPATDRCGP